MTQLANVYDFDGTIYDGDSSVDFFRFCLKRHPGIARAAPRQLAAAVSYYVLHRGTKTAMKERLYSYMARLGDARDEVGPFWDAHRYKIKGYYPPQHEGGDIVISASPVFLLQPMCSELGVSYLIASEVDPCSGRTLSENCHGEQKVRLLHERYPDVEVRQFYSDSHADDPLARIAREAFMVRGNDITPWRFE